MKPPISLPALRAAGRLLTLPALFTATPLAAQVPRVLNFQGRVTAGGVNFSGNGRFKFALIDAGTNTAQTATGTAVVNNGFVTAVNVTSGGTGYTTAPPVTISGDGRNAAATATVAGGAVTGITITNPGSDYTSATVLIAPPPPNIVYQTLWSHDGTSTAGSEPAGNVGIPVTAGLYSAALGGNGMSALPASVFDQSGVQLRVWFDDGVHGSQLLLPDQPIRAVAYALMAAGVEDNAITTAKIAPGAVNSADLAAGAVQSSNLAPAAVTAPAIAAGAVQTAHIANGSVTSAQLAKPPRAGAAAVGMASSQVDFGQFYFQHTYAPAFAAPPVVTLSLQTAAVPSIFSSPTITTSTAGGFAAAVSVPPQPASVSLTADQYSSSLLDAGPDSGVFYAVGYNELRFARLNGSGWSVVKPEGEAAISFTSAALVAGNPAVAWVDVTAGAIRFSRAANTSGASWGAFVTVASPGPQVSALSLAIIGGSPALAYAVSGNVHYVRATNASGLAWGVPVTAASNLAPIYSCSLRETAGGPAVAVTAGDLQGAPPNVNCYFLRSAIPSGTQWSTPLWLDGLSYPAGTTAALHAAGGVPVIVWSPNKLRLLRAQDATGTAWNAPLNLADAADECAMTQVEGRLAVAWSMANDPRLHYIRAFNTDATQWAPPVVAATFPGGSSGWIGLVENASTQPGGGITAMRPAIASHVTAAGKLYIADPSPVTAPLPPFQLNWIAIEP